jgi:hypothetical protein
MDITKVSWAMLVCPFECIYVADRSTAMLGYMVGYMDVLEGSRAFLGCQVRYMDIMEGLRDMLSYMER